MSTIGCDLHSRCQVVAWIMEDTGEIKVGGWNTKVKKCESFAGSGRAGR
jgi:hypothetical protein